MKKKYETKKNITKLLIFLKEIENGKQEDKRPNSKGSKLRSN